jgi:hypothetical protein
MTHPQQPELSRSDKGQTVQSAKESKARQKIDRDDTPGVRGTDKSGRRGKSLPPEQQSPYPS